jgi:hypothetical protein
LVDSRSSFGRLAALRSSAPSDRVRDLHPAGFVPLALRRALLRVESRARRVRARLAGRRPHV